MKSIVIQKDFMKVLLNLNPGSFHLALFFQLFIGSSGSDFAATVYSPLDSGYNDDKAGIQA